MAIDKLVTLKNLGLPDEWPTVGKFDNDTN